MCVKSIIHPPGVFWACLVAIWVAERKIKRRERKVFQGRWQAWNPLTLGRLKIAKKFFFSKSHAPHALTCENNSNLAFKSNFSCPKSAYLFAQPRVPSVFPYIYLKLYCLLKFDSWPNSANSSVENNLHPKLGRPVITAMWIQWQSLHLKKMVKFLAQQAIFVGKSPPPRFVVLQCRDSANFSKVLFVKKYYKPFPDQPPLPTPPCLTSPPQYLK